MGVHRDCRDEKDHAGRRRGRTKDLFEIRHKKGEANQAHTGKLFKSFHDVINLMVE